MKACEEIQGYLLDRVLGEVLPGSIEVELREHLSLCPGCRRRFEESEAAWRSLDILEEVRFPETISRGVLHRAATRPPVFRLPGLPYTIRRLSAYAAAASLLLAAGLYIIFRGGLLSDQDAQPAVIHSASTFIPGEVPMPDLILTMDSYLNDTGNILYGIREGAYITWGSILSEIISLDIQGRANYLFENPDLPHTARPVIGVLHDAFQQMLQSGRGHEKDEVCLPPGINPEALLAEVDKARCESAEFQ